MGVIKHRTITQDQFYEAQKDLHLLYFEKDLLEDTINFATSLLTQAETNGLIMKNEKVKLLNKYLLKIKRINKQINKNSMINELYNYII